MVRSLESREIFRRASPNGWVLVSTPYVVEEVLRNLPDLAPSASAEWARMRPSLLLMDDVLTLDRPVVFHASKDRPVLFGALAWADVLLTLDRGDFGALMAEPFYGLLGTQAWRVPATGACRWTAQVKRYALPPPRLNLGSRGRVCPNLPERDRQLDALIRECSCPGTGSGFARRNAANSRCTTCRGGSGAVS